MSKALMCMVGLWMLIGLGWGMQVTPTVDAQAEDESFETLRYLVADPNTTARLTVQVPRAWVYETTVQIIPENEGGYASVFAADSRATLASINGNALVDGSAVTIIGVTQVGSAIERFNGFNDFFGREAGLTFENPVTYTQAGFDDGLTFTVTGNINPARGYIMTNKWGAVLVQVQGINADPAIVDRILNRVMIGDPTLDQTQAPDGLGESAAFLLGNETVLAVRLPTDWIYYWGIEFDISFLVAAPDWPTMQAVFETDTPRGPYVLLAWDAEGPSPNQVYDQALAGGGEVGPLTAQAHPHLGEGLRYSTDDLAVETFAFENDFGVFVYAAAPYPAQNERFNTILASITLTERVVAE